MTSLSEAETKVTKTGKVHKGDYGTSYDGDDEKKPAASTEKRGRGRPKKGADDSGEVKSYDTKSLGSVFGGGQKPKKEIGKVSKKHSLKEYIEEAEEAIQEGMTSQSPIQIKPASQTQTQVIQQGDKTLGTVNNPQLAAQIKQSIGKGEMTLNPDEEMQEGKDEGNDLVKLSNVIASCKTKEQLAAAQNMANNFLAKHRAGGFSNMGKDMGRLRDVEATLKDKNREIQGSQELGEAKPDFLDVDKDGNKKESFKKAVADKSKKKVAEGRDHESSEYLDEKVAKILAREKPGMDTVKSNDEFYGAIYNELIQCGLTPKAARHKVSYDEDFISDVASAYAHYQKNPSLDEGSMDDFAMRGIGPTNDFTRAGSSMAVPRTAPSVTTKKEQTPWSVDPINAATDRVGSFISSLGKKNSTFEGTDMKDIQLESWESQLDSLLTEGITVSSSQGQQGAPDSVSVTATDNDAQSLMSVLRNAGIGGFGAGEQQPEIGYGVVQGGEEDFNGTGTEPQPSPDVVGDGDDMLSLIKKMTGINDAPEQDGQDYEDEEGQEAGALEPTSGDEEGSEEQDSSEEADDEEEQTDEGNAFTGKLKQTPQGGSFKMGDKEYKDTSELEEQEEESCNECGMHESKCGCEHEQVEENYANSTQDPVDAELMKLKALLAMGNDLHKMKTDQTVGNPTRVSVRESINEWKKLSGL